MAGQKRKKIKNIKEWGGKKMSYDIYAYICPEGEPPPKPMLLSRLFQSGEYVEYGAYGQHCGNTILRKIVQIRLNRMIADVSKRMGYKPDKLEWIEHDKTLGFRALYHR
jgi:hypothetical protein